ncbi:uncharacterized protein LOC116343437 [Contarinia nasturtii]|uniref:uncharacterized protein LOC116343437 n=1 Tax=Contarinia nasturtii TaxID=265458 RepID=UPI0012D45291|nr:uncharacterized protein LOC116343437 [Contarinia nasturtii]
MIKFHVIEHGWKFLFFILWIGIDVEQNVSLAASSSKPGPSNKLTEITSEILTPWRLLSDDAINYFINFVNEAQMKMPSIKKKYHLLEVTVSQFPDECKHFAKTDQDDVQIMYGGAGGVVGGENAIGHYVCVHYLHEKQEVHVYDSLLRTNLNSRQTEVLKVLYPKVDLTNSLHFIRPKTTQYDASSCGVFSIAYATTVIFGKDPHTYILQLSTTKPFFESSVDYSVSLRKHLIRMLETENFSIFPEGDPATEPIIPVPQPSTMSVYRENYTENEPIVDTITVGKIDETTHESHKFVAKLFYKIKGDDSFCISTATVLSPTKIVTAAQNLANSEKAFLSFNTLSTKDNKFKVDINMKSEVFIHPQYDESDAHANDVAVILLKKPFAAAKGIKMVASSYTIFQNTPVTMLGFSCQELGYINTTVSNFVSCRHQYYKKNQKFLEDGKQFCVQTGNNRISTGWIGGPIVTSQNEFAGIMSYDYKGLPKVCTCLSQSIHDFISKPKYFTAKNKKVGFPWISMKMML